MPKMLPEITPKYVPRLYRHLRGQPSETSGGSG
jgi:hypothetical protein